MKSVCVIGLGYIGLPTASILATNGFHVLGVDIDPAVVATVNRGQIHIDEPGLHTIVRAAIQSGNLKSALKPAAADVFILAVPTPLTGDKRPDMSHVRATADAIVPYLRRGTLVILESTSPPGTCLDLLVPILERSGLKVGHDLHLAHCPERVLPGHILQELIGNDRVIGGFDRASAEKARDLYGAFVEGSMLLTDLTTAEFVKVLENTYRDVNIALANEAALLCERLGIRFQEAARLANHHPRVNVHLAGPGVGGHCIPIDPWFLVDRFPEQASLIHLARLRNDGMPEYVADGVLDLLAGVPMPKVAALGLAFKGNVGDMRESPALTVIRLLQARGLEVVAHDPFVCNAPVALETLDNALQGADCVLVLTDHDVYRHLSPAHAQRLVRSHVVYDTRNVFDHEGWRRAGFKVKVLGSG